MTSSNLTSFRSQRSGAKSRRIEWCLTFEEWLAWWGDDVDRRGRGTNDLQMQRIGDTGPYALWNIIKGTPKENTATANEQISKRYEEWINAGNVEQPYIMTKIGDAVVDPDADYDLEEEMEESLQSVVIGRNGRPMPSRERLRTNFQSF